MVSLVLATAAKEIESSCLKPVISFSKDKSLGLLGYISLICLDHLIELVGNIEDRVDCVTVYLAFQGLADLLKPLFHFAVLFSGEFLLYFL